MLNKYCIMLLLQEVLGRNVNGAGKLRVVAPPYPIRLFFFIFTGTCGYLQNYLKNKYLIINLNKIK